MNNRSVDAPQRSRILARRLRVAVLTCMAFSAGCGGRTGFADDSMFVASSAGATGAPCAKDWDRIVWDEPIGEAAVYLWTESASNTWAVVSDNIEGAQAFYRDHWDGARWTRTAGAGDTSQRFENRQIWAAKGGLAFAGASNQVQRWSGESWQNWGGTGQLSRLWWYD